MSYATLLVHIDLDQNNDARLRVAGDLAERFGARVIGVAAQAEILPVFYTADGYAAGFVAEDNLADIKKRVQQAEERFRAALTGRVKQLEWRSSLEDPSEFIAEQSRAADLVVIGKTPSDETQEPLDQISPSDLIGHIGRPLLIVPHDVKALTAERVIVAWKDTREARRAAFDALPFLKRAQQVIVYEVDENRDPAEAQRHVDDVAKWLGGHGVNAAGRVEPLRDSPALQLEALAKKEGADLIVAGAFGHGKLREWILGGVTRDLLGQSSCCQLLAH
ncbi:universal stress protein [Methylocapsa palsarum]|uniref:Nucleotide-binding universal stress protein, UspA family n=1 Tax=Methylocapsa palsarum TaxID=1612308 RepID=A0A1I3Y6N7_9HYPH|nr:universal stress protein [Methylocapsa palsarum]SFK27508.1 Nucleotide-binding universal stress protein, UspA family [Methylocapsa palsarum]